MSAANKKSPNHEHVARDSGFLVSAWADQQRTLTAVFCCLICEQGRYLVHRSLFATHSEFLMLAHY
jgi:hypothetical protein